MIGVFDSGIGGLTLLHELTKTLIHEDFAYYADIDNVPYSYKSPEQILNYVEDAVLFLRQKGAKAIVLACNTATNVAVEYLREIYDFPIIAIQPAVKVAADFSEDHKKILACATPVTLNAARYKRLIEKLGIEKRITNVALPRLVEFAENGIFTGPEVEDYLMGKLRGYNNSDYHFVVLGCTHFTFYEKLIERQFPFLKTIDGNFGTAKQVKKVLTELNLLKESGSGYLTFYESGREVKEVSKYLKLILKLRA